MNRYYYDFHTHSCLSPCADDDMTPNNLAGMAALAGIGILALTDHNSCGNCPAFFAAAKRYGIVPIAGMELTTAEDIHVVCLFEQLEQAMLFDRAVGEKRILIKNRADIFGNQIKTDEEDRQIRTEEFLLSNATQIRIDEIVDFVNRYDGIVYPAHVDREANGMITTLGTFPDTPRFLCAEFHDASNISEYQKRYPILQDIRILVGSDAHCFESLRDAEFYFDIEADAQNPEEVRKKIFRILRGEEQ